MSSIRGLIQRLSNPDSMTRIEAAESLGNATTIAESALAALIPALADHNAHVRRAAVEALGKLAELGNRDGIVVVVRGMLEDKNKGVQAAARDVIQRNSSK